MPRLIAKSCMSITVEIEAGSEPREVFIEARSRAIEWNLAFINFQFSDVLFSVSQDADIDKLVKSYMNNLQGIGAPVDYIID